MLFSQGMKTLQSLINGPKPMQGKKITFLGISSGICAPTSKGQIGAELGFDAIRAEALSAQAPAKEGDFDPRKIFIDNETEKVVTLSDLYDYIDELDNSDVFFQDLEPQPKDPLKNTRFARHIGYLVDIYKKIKAKVYETLKYDEFPFIIAGDHSTAAATIGGIKKYLGKYHPQKKLGVIWIDAHVDANSPFSTPSGNMHGMPVGMACGIQSNLDPLRISTDLKEKHETKRLNTIRTEDILDKWKQLFVDPKDRDNLKNTDFVFIGIRDYQPHERQFLLGRDVDSRPGAKRSPRQITHHYKFSDGENSAGEIEAYFPKIRNHNNQERTIQQVAEETIRYFKTNGYDCLYISLDIDAITGYNLKEVDTHQEAFDAMVTNGKTEPVFGTGTPVPNGLSLAEVKYLLHYFIYVQKDIPVIAFEMVEVSPLLDIQNRTSRLAFDIIKSLLNPSPVPAKKTRHGKDQIA